MREKCSRTTIGSCVNHASLGHIFWAGLVRFLPFGARSPHFQSVALVDFTCLPATEASFQLWTWRLKRLCQRNLLREPLQGDAHEDLPQDELQSHGKHARCSPFVQGHVFAQDMRLPGLEARLRVHLAAHPHLHTGRYSSTRETRRAERLAAFATRSSTLSNTCAVGPTHRQLATSARRC